MTPLLAFENVACTRGGRVLFEGLDLEIGPGDAVLVTGANGSGKSSLIRVAAGLLRPAGGRVSRSRLALADDLVALDRELPLRDALCFWGGDVDGAMEALGLVPLASVPVRLLSAGQAKRASLARAAATRAPLWLLDEPANALDAAALERLALLLEGHRSNGGAVVAASHAALPGAWRELELGR